MNKSAIQKYAISARRDLIEQIRQRAYNYGIKETGYGDEDPTVIEGRVLSTDEKRQRRELVTEIKKHGYPQTIEETAYTWFNRFVALRFMEVNNYLPTNVRIFSDIKGNFKPEIIEKVLSNEVELDGLDKTKVSKLFNDSQTEELYRYLLLTQCNALNAVMPEMFERLGSYTEMLLPNNILKQDSVLARLVNDIPEEDWRDGVQIIGWLYQYYNTEPKQTVFDGLKENVKISKEKIPAATQLFTPDWIVRYMVENSLGRLWLESRPNSNLKDNWKYYVDEAEQTPEVAEKLRTMRNQSPIRSPEDIRLIDPCMGSGHILVYAFDVLIQIYVSEGYSERDAAKLILEKNIYGLDIDRRAYQLAYFALMMKARQYNRRIFTQNIMPQVYHPGGFPDGEEYGSLVKIKKLEPKPEKKEDVTLFDEVYETKLNAWNFKRVLAQKYEVVVTNPPYMGSSGMNGKLTTFVKNNYPDSKSDLFAVFIERCSELLKPIGYQAMITQHSWMFLSSYEKLRKKLLQRNIVNMVHLGARAFEEIGGEVVQATAFVMANSKTFSFLGRYFRLVDFGSQDEKEEAFLSGKNRYTAVTDNFAKIPGSPVAYWVRGKMLKAFEGENIEQFGAKLISGNKTADNEKYLRFLWEVDATTVGHKWILYAKGGNYRKWYGNIMHLVNWSENARKNYQANPSACIIGKQDWFKIGATWTDLTSGAFSLRYLSENSLFDMSGPAMLIKQEDKLLYAIGLFNTNIVNTILEMTNSSFHVKLNDIRKVAIKSTNDSTKCNSLVTTNISLSRTDWDAFETSWDFKNHPLINGEQTVSASFEKWSQECEKRFKTLKANEEELNRIFINIYGLNDELTPDVNDKDVTVRRADLERDIRSFISYAVGCMFGRYSLDCEGLAYAGGPWDSAKYRTFIPNADNIIPISDDEYFDTDVVSRFVELVKVVYGEGVLEENLTFIANALGGRGTPREVIRNYFLNGFYADHCKIYQKRPIYWLFDSGKNNGFKALIYLHRYSRDLLAKLRTNYVHELQERYRTQLSHIDADLNNATGVERVRLLTRQNKLHNQSKEIGVYEEKIHHLADKNITIDLDDGVKNNYAVLADVLAKI